MSIATRYGNTAASGALARAAAIAASLMLGACAQMGSIGSEIADAGPAADGKPKLAASQGDLQKALEYWSKEHEKAPRELKPALAYARNLKAAGQQERALGVLQHASMFHSHDRELLSDYGRLALDADQLSLAQKLLEAADDPGKPDWRILSGRGTVLAKQGLYGDAIPFYERALSSSPDQPSVLNNLAMALAADGQADKAETMLRRAAEAKNSDPKVKRNLALVLGLQGKHDAARQIAALDATPAVATADADHLRRTVKAEPQPIVAVPVVLAKASAAEPALPVVQASTKAVAKAELVDPDAAADAIIQKAVAAAAGLEKAAAQKAKPKGSQPALKATRDDQVAGTSAWRGPVAQNSSTGAGAGMGAIDLKPSAR